MPLSPSHGDAVRDSPDDSELGNGKRRKLLRCDSSSAKGSHIVSDKEPSFPVVRRVLRSAVAKPAGEKAREENGTRKKIAANGGKSGGRYRVNRWGETQKKSAGRSESDRQRGGDDGISVAKAAGEKTVVRAAGEKAGEENDSGKKNAADGGESGGSSGKYWVNHEGETQKKSVARSESNRQMGGDDRISVEKARDRRDDSAKKTEAEKTKEASVENKRITRSSAGTKTEEKKPAVKLTAGKRMKEVEALQMDGTRSGQSRKRGNEVLDVSDAKKTPGSGNIRLSKHLDQITAKRLKNNGARSVGISLTLQEGDGGDLCESPRSKGTGMSQNSSSPRGGSVTPRNGSGGALRQSPRSIKSGRSNGSVTLQNASGDALRESFRCKKTGRFQKSSSLSADKGNGSGDALRQSSRSKKSSRFQKSSSQCADKGNGSGDALRESSRNKKSDRFQKSSSQCADKGNGSGDALRESSRNKKSDRFQKSSSQCADKGNGSGDALRESSRSKKSDRFQKSSSLSADKGNGSGDALHESTRSKKSVRFQKSSSLSTDKGKAKASVTPNSGSRRATRSSSMQSRTKKTASAQKKPSSESKSVKKASESDSSNIKNLVVVKGQSSSTSTRPPPTRQIEHAKRTELQSARKKLRAQLKDILLNAGWKIDLRPRLGRQYNDSVYISPKGNSCWSITRAYGVFLRQMNLADGVADSNSGKSSNRSKDKRQKALVSPDALTILNKVIMKRRCDFQTKKTKRSKAEIEKSKRKVGDISRKKTKDAASMKHQITKHLKAKGREFKKTKRNNTANSTAKAIIRMKNRIDKGIVSSVRKRSVQKRAARKPRGNALLVRGSHQGEDVYVPYEFGRSILTWLIDLGVVPENRKIVYMNPNGTKNLFEGYLTKEGIHCYCCRRILSVLQFEDHAGSNLGQPYQNIYIDGASLLQFQTVALENHGGSVCQRFVSVDSAGEDLNDDTCGICGDGGDLMCCDSCPSTFHLDCLGLQMLPTGDWHCMICSCKYCNLVSSPNLEEKDATECTLFSCALCEKKYHRKCIPEGEVVPVCSVLPSMSFCGNSCKKIFQGLQKLVGLKNELGEGFSLTLLQHLSEDVPESVLTPDQRIECNAKIAVAFTVMDECFLPIIDKRSGIDLINNVVYSCGSSFNRLNYRSFYTYILERDEEIISVATLRIHGTKFAEMPFIGTRNKFRLQGMCRRLLNGIYSALHSLNVEKLIIPAISELVKAWTNVFGFKHAEVLLREELRSVNILVFPGTGLLYKTIQTVSSEQPLGVDIQKHTSEAAETSLACSSHGLEPNLSGNVIAECKLEVNAIVPDLSELSPPDSFDSRLGSEPQVLVHKSSEPANDEVLAIQGIVPGPSEVVSESQILEYQSPEAITDVVVAHDVIAPDSSEVAPEVCDSPHGAEPRVLVCKSSEGPVEAVVDDNVHAASSFGQETDDKAELASIYTVQYPLDNGKHPSEEKCKSVDDSTSTLQESGDDTLPPDLNDICTSPNTIVSTSAGFGENGHQSAPVCSEGSNSDAGHFDGYDVGHMVNESEMKPADRVDDGDVSVVTKTSVGKEGIDSSVTSRCADTMKTSELPSKKNI